MLVDRCTAAVLRASPWSSSLPRPQLLAGFPSQRHSTRSVMASAAAAAATAPAPVPAPELGPRTPMPAILYGTAWKGPASTPLVFNALRTGFRGIDTAAQLKHYDEAAVGQGVRDALAAGVAAASASSPSSVADPELRGLTRSQLWIQTKCTPPAGQDWSRPVPYARTDRAAEAVRKSFALSLWNLATDERWREAHPPAPYGLGGHTRTRSGDAKGKQRDFSGSTGASAPSPLDLLSDAAVSLLPSDADAASNAAAAASYPAPGSTLYPHLRPRTSAVEPYIDSYLLHSPFDSLEDTVEAWREMENLVRLGWIRRIGLSNVYDPRILQVLRTHFVTTPSTPIGHAEAGGGPTYPIAPTILQNRWHNSTLHDVSLFSLLSPTLSPNDFADVAGRIQSQKEGAEAHLAAARDQVASLEPRQLEAPQPETDDPTQVQAVTYQAFWILTGNPSLLTRPAVLENVQIINAYLPQSISPPLPERSPAEDTPFQRALRSTRWTPQMLLYATVALGLGGVPGLSTAVLCGSTDATHMLEALVAVHRAEALRAAETGVRAPGTRERAAWVGPKEREREEAHNVALREAIDAIRREIYGE